MWLAVLSLWLCGFRREEKGKTVGAGDIYTDAKILIRARPGSSDLAIVNVLYCWLLVAYLEAGDFHSLCVFS